MNKSSLYALILGFCALSAEAQIDAAYDVTNPVLQEINIERHLWFNSSNSAGMGIAPLNSYHNVSFDAFYTEGDLKLYQAGKKEKGLIFNTEGTAQYKGLSLWGTFKFENNFSTSSMYNAMLYEPTVNMPFYAADSKLSDWKRQNYEMGFRMATPVYHDKVSFGFEANYSDKEGAKQMDPRAETYRYDIDFSPSAVWLLNPSNRLGIALSYKHYSEQSVPSVENASEDPEVAIMRGLGFYTLGKVGGNTGLKEHIYVGNQYGASVQYNLLGDHFEVLADIGFAMRGVDVTQNPRQPKIMGSTNEMLVDASVQALFGEKMNHRLSLSFTTSMTDGIEYVQSFNSDPSVQSWIVASSNVMSNYTQNEIDITYDVMTPINPFIGYRWKYGVNASFYMLSEIYYVPQSSFDASHLYAEAFVKRNFLTGKKSMMSIGLAGGYNYSLGGSYLYTGSTNKTSAIVTDFYPEDLKILTTDYISGTANASFSYRIGEQASLYIKAEATYRKPLSMSIDRLLSSVSIGCLF